MKNGHSLHLEYYIITALPCEGGKEGHTSDSKEGNASESKEGLVLDCIDENALDNKKGHMLDCKGDMSQTPWMDIS